MLSMVGCMSCRIVDGNGDGDGGLFGGAEAELAWYVDSAVDTI